jgi:hypothetical protein
VILERRILLRVENLEERRRRITEDVDPHLVDLVEHQNRIADTDLLHPLDDPARQRSDVRAPVPADLGLIAHAAEGNPVVTAAHRAGYRTTERCLSDARRTDETQNGRLLAPGELADRHVLDHPLLDLLEPVVVFVQASARLFDVELVASQAAPREVRDPLEVGPGDVVLRRLRLHPAHPAELLARDLLHLFRQPRGAQPVAQLLDFVFLAAFAELLFDRPHLLPQYLLALGLALVGDHRAYLLLDPKELELPTDDAEHGAHPRLGIERLENFLLLRNTRLLGREIGRDEVRERSTLTHVVKNAGRLARQVWHERQQVPHAFAETRAQRVELGVPLQVFGHPSHARAHERLEHGVLCNLKARQPVQHDGVVARPEAKHFDHTRDGADLVEVLKSGLVHFGVPLAHDADDRPLMAGEILDEPHAAWPPDVDRHDARGKDDAITERQDREKLGLGWRTEVAHLSKAYTASPGLSPQSRRTHALALRSGPRRAPTGRGAERITAALTSGGDGSQAARTPAATDPSDRAWRLRVRPGSRPC